MKILSYNPGHDGAIAYLQDSRLIFSIESEKDSNYRHSAVSVTDVLDAVSLLGDTPDVICMSGWWPLHHHEYLYGSDRNSGYRGLSCANSIVDKGRLLRGKVDFFSSSHERSHLLCAFGMSALPMGTPCYALVWEGEMGTFYEIDPEMNITLIADVLKQPGNRYSLLYGLADPTFPKDGPYPRNSDAGKLMALASFSKRSTPSAAEKQTRGGIRAIAFSARRVGASGATCLIEWQKPSWRSASRYDGRCHRECHQPNWYTRYATLKSNGAK